MSIDLLALIHHVYALLARPENPATGTRIRSSSTRLATEYLIPFLAKTSDLCLEHIPFFEFQASVCCNFHDLPPSLGTFIKMTSKN